MYVKDINILLVQVFDRLSFGYGSLNVAHFEHGLAVNIANQIPENNESN